MSEIINERDIYKKNLENDIDKAKKLDVLLNDDNFISLFEKHFVEDYAVTQVRNYAALNEDQRRRVHENMIGRSVFTRFMNSVLEQGNTAFVHLKELESETNEEGTN